MLDAIKLPKLKGSLNYDLWAIRIEAILVEKGYLGYILSNPATTIDNIDSIDENAYKATALIKLALEDGPLLQTRFISNPFILWNTLKNLYEAKGFSSEFLLSKELINTTLSSYKGNLEDYINSFKRVVNSLESRGISLPNRFVVALLLNNLSKDYEYIVTVITQSIRTSNNINLEEIVAQLLDESRRLSANKNTKNSNSSNYNTYSSSSKDNSSSSYSNNIEMSMQTTKNNKKNTKNKDNKSIPKCNYCNKKGHLESNCFIKNPSLKKDKSINNSSNIEEQVLSSSIKSSNSSKSPTIDFILDSGATIHTCYIKELFTSLRPSSTSIKWGNTSTTIKAQGIGDISIVFTSTKQLVKLTNVLYVPNLG
ncbi:MAG: hypothetical protein EOP33_09415, partial [Rickettsiaceae bacterium]